MSDRFVSSGTVDSNGETAATEAQDGTATGQSQVKSQQWEAAKRQLEEERRQRDEARLKAASGEEKSLYDILQANKAAKQAAFEEKNKIANQFLTLDDHDVEFLDEVRERQRNEELERKRELEDGLKAFREAQQGGGKEGEGEDEVKAADGDGEVWGVGKKRKRAREAVLKGVRRKTASGKDDGIDGEAGAKKMVEKPASTAKPEPAKPEPAKPVAAGSGSGLVAYGSDSDSDSD